MIYNKESVNGVTCFANQKNSKSDETEYKLHIPKLDAQSQKLFTVKVIDLVSIKLMEYRNMSLSQIYYQGHHYHMCPILIPPMVNGVRNKITFRE